MFKRKVLWQFLNGWLLLNLSFDMEIVAYSASVQREGDECECSNSKCISLLSVVGKLFGRVLIERVRVVLNVQ